MSPRVRTSPPHFRDLSKSAASREMLNHLFILRTQVIQTNLQQQESFFPGEGAEL